MGAKTPVAILGATGTVGQRFVALLADHPWFEIAELAASGRSAGKTYERAVSWVQATPVPAQATGKVVREADCASVRHCPLAFSALDAEVAGPIERSLADAGVFVVSNAKSHRLAPDVPLVVPEINPDHLALLERQRASRPGGGAIVTNPNCSTIGLVLALKPLHDAFGVRSVHVVTLQAVSGAGLPGMPSLRILDNVVPRIPGEEEKIEAESRKILGRLVEGAVRECEVGISAQCNRVPVVDGHLLCISVGLEKPASPGEAIEALRTFSGEPQRRRLPSAPADPIVCLDGPDAPQPRLHRDVGDGMATVIGRVRPCPVLDLRLVALTHNTLRGAAGGAILLGELIRARALLG
jgi:aspartate-semialdehyde dehydrogenase